VASSSGVRPAFIGLLICSGGIACGRPYVNTERGPQAYYQTGFPVRDVSRDLERILRAVKRTQVSVSYDVYRFPRNARITERDVRSSLTFASATEKLSIDHALIGSASIYAHVGTRIELITNDHVTRVPDTIIAYFGDQDEVTRSPSSQTRYVESVAIKTSQINLVNDLPEIGHFRIIARDSASDIALIAVELEAEHRGMIDVLNVTRGDPAQLVWGSFVYVIGYPQGFKMVTRGIVSDPRRGRDDSFLLDGLFNRGISGGPIFAIRGDTGELEWIGMARSASAHPELILSPERRRIQEDGVTLPYEGRLYIEQVSRIDYGVTFSVSMTAIQRFLRARNRTD
jgi:S1-C subfamily serine protease